MSNYNRPDDRYPPDDEYPPRGPRRPAAPGRGTPQERPPSRRPDYAPPPLEAPRAPDLRQRSSAYRQLRSRPQRGTRPVEDYDGEPDDDYYEDEPPRRSRFQQGCAGFSGLDWIFLVALLLAAARGTGATKGCLPGRRCVNTLLVNIAGILMIFGGIYYAAENGENSTVTTALIGGGALTCLLGGGAIIGLIAFTARMIDLDNLGGGALDEMGGGFLDNILGRR